MEAGTKPRHDVRRAIRQLFQANGKLQEEICILHQEVRLLKRPKLVLNALCESDPDLLRYIHRVEPCTSCAVSGVAPYGVQLDENREMGPETCVNTSLVGGPTGDELGNIAGDFLQMPPLIPGTRSGVEEGPLASPDGEFTGSLPQLTIHKKKKKRRKREDKANKEVRPGEGQIQRSSDGNSASKGVNFEPKRSDLDGDGEAQAPAAAAPVTISENAGIEFLAPGLQRQPEAGENVHEVEYGGEESFPTVISTVSEELYSVGSAGSMVMQVMAEGDYVRLAEISLCSTPDLQKVIFLAASQQADYALKELHEVEAEVEAQRAEIDSTAASIEAQIAEWQDLQSQASHVAGRPRGRKEGAKLLTHAEGTLASMRARLDTLANSRLVNQKSVIRARLQHRYLCEIDKAIRAGDLAAVRTWQGRLEEMP